MADGATLTRTGTVPAPGNAVRRPLSRIPRPFVEWCPRGVRPRVGTGLRPTGCAVHQLIRLKRAGASGDDLWPDLTWELAPRLDVGENVRWRGTAEVSQLTYIRDSGGDFTLAWSLKDTASVLITDRRVMYVGRTLEPHKGLPPVAARGLPGRRSTAGDVERYVGHVRFEWTANVIFESIKHLAVRVAAISLTCVDAGTGLPVRLMLTMNYTLHHMRVPFVADVAGQLARDIAGSRLRTRGGLGDEDVAGLAAVRDGADPVTTAHGLRWDLPGHRVIAAGTHEPSTQVAAAPAPSTAVAPLPAVPASPPAPHARPRVSLGTRLTDVLAMGFAVVLALAGLVGLLRLAGVAQAVRARDQARAATAAGDVRVATRDWLTVLRAAPQSREALLRIACLSWDAGYEDEAVLYFQRALTAGARWNAPVNGARCFVNEPSLHRLALVDRSLPMIYVRPASGDPDGELLEQIARASDPPTDSRVPLAVACLNDRAGLTYLSAMGFTVALGTATEAIASTGVLRRCLDSMKDRYGFVRRNGMELFLPYDFSDRVFIPESSPIPSRIGRVLP
jgi:hypothetical protein